MLEAEIFPVTITIARFHDPAQGHFAGLRAVVAAAGNVNLKHHNSVGFALFFLVARGFHRFDQRVPLRLLFSRGIGLPLFPPALTRAEPERIFMQVRHDVFVKSVFGHLLRFLSKYVL